MHHRTRNFLAARIVRAADILNLAEKFRICMERMQEIFDSYASAEAGDRSYHLQVYMKALLLYGSQFFFTLLETRVIPPAKLKKYLAVMNLVIRAKRAPNKPWTWFQKNSAVLQEILATWKTWPDKSSVQGDTLDKFTVGPFTVHNVNRVGMEALDGVQNLFKKIVQLVSKSDIPRVQEVLYGDVLVMDKISTGKVLGLYRVDEDKVYVRPLAKVSHDQLQVLLHELGHRYWYKVSTLAQKRKAWSVHFNYGRMTSTKLPVEGEELPFKVQGLKRPITVLSASSAFQVTDGRKTVSISRKSMWDIMHRIQVANAFPTSYAAKSEEEYFSEAFALRILGKLTGEHAALFDSVLEAQ